MAVPPSGLSPLQERILGVLSGLEPTWTLSGGAALVGVHGVRRTTRDVNLFYHALGRLGGIPGQVTKRLDSDGLQVSPLQSGDSFHRVRVADGSEDVVLDLVADPVEVVEPPVLHDLVGGSILVDTPHEILVNKLCALLGRAELVARISEVSRPRG